jgi:hypothetical protein
MDPQLIGTLAIFMLSGSLVSGAMGIVRTYEERNQEAGPVDVKARIGRRPAGRKRRLINRTTGRSEFRTRVWNKTHPWMPAVIEPPEKHETWLERQQNRRWRRS